MALRIIIGLAAIVTLGACDTMHSPVTPTDIAPVAAPAAASPQSHSTHAQASRPQPTQSQPSSRAARAAQSQSHERQVIMNDACDAESFNAVLGAGTCVGRGGVTFDRFIGQLTRSERVASWFFAPPRTTARVGDTFVAVNRGGETHTFTEVSDFAGGIVDDLNDLMHLSMVAPECAALAPRDFVPAGGTYRANITDPGVAKYMCCIHPWMRLQANVK